MGLFGTKEICSVCNEYESSKKLVDGCICKECIKRSRPCIITLSWKNIDVEKVRRAITASENNAELMEMFQPTKKVQKYISFDERNKLWTISGYNILFKYEDILSYELLEDGESITKGGLGGALVGGALFGGAGAIVGGITGKKKTKKEINEFRIKIITRNEFYPEVYINFLIAGSIKSGSMTYKGYKDAAQKIITELTLITDSLSGNESLNDVAMISGADEIVKYKKLFDDGIITQEEFDAKKRQLLGL